MAGTADPTMVGASGNAWLDGILGSTRWDSPGPRTVVSTYIADQQSVTLAGTAVYAHGPHQAELSAMVAAMNAIEEVCNIDFQLVGSQADADLIWAVVGNADSEGFLGWAYLPGDETNVAGEAQSLIAINWELYNPTDGGGLVRGGFDFSTYAHELGHAVGLAHPHDRSGGSTIWPGVGSAFDDLGDLDMNQGVFTTMGYNDGWRTAPHGVTPSPVFGRQAGPMALDIAALQFMYGVNTSTRAGDTTYDLPRSNAVGASYSCIWDAGGVDVIRGAAARANTIDLRAATLAEAPGGGGFVSWAAGIHGGFTIANGAVIENAIGGALGDTLRGNAGANRLAGGGGNDVLTGFGGADRLVGGGGADDFVFAAAGDSGAGAARDVVEGFTRGQDDIVLAAIDARAGAPGNQAFYLDQSGPLGAGGIRQVDTGSGVVLRINTDADAAPEMIILIQGVPGLLSAGDFVL